MQGTPDLPRLSFRIEGISDFQGIRVQLDHRINIGTFFVDLRNTLRI